jgi:hypothetical protein
MSMNSISGASGQPVRQQEEAHGSRRHAAARIAASEGSNVRRQEGAREQAAMRKQEAREEMAKPAVKPGRSDMGHIDVTA